MKRFLRSTLRSTVVLVALGSFETCGFSADSWPSFQNGGHVGTKAVAIAADLKPRWEIGLRGYGQSTPIVWKNQVYVTTVEGAKKETCHVTGYSLTDGRQLWQHSFASATPQENNNYVSRAAPTPAADERGLVCLFESGNVVALSHDGKVRWERNLVAEYGALATRHGLAASVEQSADHVYLWIERSEDPYIVSLSKDSGETKWKSLGIGATSWASPRLVPVEGGHHLVLSASGFLAGLDPADGKLLWKLSGLSGNSTPTPMPMGGGKFLIGATVGRGEAGAGKSAESNGVVQIDKAAGGEWSASYLWKAKRATSSFASPIVHDSVALFVSREGVIYGLDVQSGEEIFAKRLSGSSWATAIGLADGAVLVPARDGKLDIVTDLRGTPTVTTQKPLPEPLMSERPPVPAQPTESKSDGNIESGRGKQSGGARGGVGDFGSGPVLYSAVIAGESLLLRQGDKLYSVKVHIAAPR